MSRWTRLIAHWPAKRMKNHQGVNKKKKKKVYKNDSNVAQHPTCHSMFRFLPIFLTWTQEAEAKNTFPQHRYNTLIMQLHCFVVWIRPGRGTWKRDRRLERVPRLRIILEHDNEIKSSDTQAIMLMKSLCIHHRLIGMRPRERWHFLWFSRNQPASPNKVRTHIFFKVTEK